MTADPTIRDLRSPLLIPATAGRPYLGEPGIPHPREAVIREADSGEEHAGFWRVLYYSGVTVLAQGREEQALDALQAVVVRSETR